MIKLLRKTLPFLAVIACIFLFREEAFAESAPYLKYRPKYVAETEDMGVNAVKLARLTCKDALADSVLIENPGLLTEIAYKADLIDCGLFLDDSNAYRQYNHLTKENGFEAYNLADCKEFGGDSYDINEGDIIFFLNEYNRPVSDGIILKNADHSILCSCETDEGFGTQIVDIIMLTNYNNIKVVNVIYPTVEEIIFAYLRDNMEFCNESCSGILSNIYSESLFNSNASEQTGQKGYGLCQWTGARKSKLKSFCEQFSLDYTHIYPQLRFLRHELKSEEFWPVDTMLRTITRNSDGAYDAAHAFCYYYLMPQNYDEVAETRGELTESFFYPAFKNA